MRLLSFVFVVGTSCELVVLYYTGSLLLGVDTNEMSVTLNDFHFPCSLFVIAFVFIRQSSCSCRVIVCTTAIGLFACQGYGWWDKE